MRVSELNEMREWAGFAREGIAQATKGQPAAAQTFRQGYEAGLDAFLSRLSYLLADNDYND